MAAERFNPGYDFVFAMLHSWWSNAAQGSRLDDLARCTTVGNLLHHLQQFGIVTVKDEENALGEFVLRQFIQLEKLGQYASPAVGAYLHLLQERLISENIKLLINYRFFPERFGHVGSNLVRFPGFPYLDSQIHAMLTAPTTAQFVRLMMAQHSFPGLEEIILKLDKDRDLPSAECAIDSVDFRRILDAAHHLPGAMRREALEYWCSVIDCENLMTLLRNAEFYHMDGAHLESSWIPHGHYMSRAFWERFAAADAKCAEILVALPPGIAEMTGDRDEKTWLQLSHLEHHLRLQFFKRAHKNFYRAGDCEAALAAYPVLLHYETLNLSCIYEGIRFSLPAREITEMLIR